MCESICWRFGCLRFGCLYLRGGIYGLFELLEKRNVRGVEAVLLVIDPDWSCQRPIVFDEVDEKEVEKVDVPGFYVYITAIQKNAVGTCSSCVTGFGQKQLR
jgi:hypothetical protein